ncbi:putative Phototropic-responsive NPH3 family protein [Hibiscus syriacus]|uniref:Phototropic-responsive NPH3 family protein n=1 Tax=Hibiscus syriacus TaxID=106335 RepID=A0A6A2WTZ1_HIBSY|nr:putative Phototropic-responsive NPH3 family protein [Hibiscus syriacus]
MLGKIGWEGLLGRSILHIAKDVPLSSRSSIASIIAESVGAYFAVVALSKEWFCVDTVIRRYACSLKPALKDEDDILKRIIGADGKESSSWGVALNNERTSGIQRETRGAMGSDVQVVSGHDRGREMHESQSVDQCMQNDMGSIRPKKLRQQALEERKNHERLESSNMSRILNKEVSEESGTKNKVRNPVGRDKDDLAAELRELGWSDMDFHDDKKKSTKLSFDGELSSLLGEIPKKINGHGTDKTQVVAIKKKALMLKREGKLAEAKEELKRAKVLEKQLEELELLVGTEDPDDELSAIIQIAASLKSLGWTEDSNPIEDDMVQSAPVKRETLLNEILSLKRAALSQKRAGNVAEAMAQLKKAKVLEKDLESFNSQPENSTANENVDAVKGLDLTRASKGKLMVQKELLSFKKNALALRREGRLDEADEELQNGRILEQQLEEMEKTAHVTNFSKGKDLKHEHPNVSESLPVEEDVTDQDMYDPTYLSILRNLGWTDNDNALSNSLVKDAKQKDSEQIIESSSIHVPSKIQTKTSRRTKAEIQRELLGLKRKAFSLRRQGNTDEAEEVLETAKALEAEMAELEAPKKVGESKFPKEKATTPARKGSAEEEEENVTEDDMTDSVMLSMLKNLGWKDEEVQSVTMKEEESKNLSHESLRSGHPSCNRSSSGIQVSPPRSKGEIQRELLGLKRKALSLRRNGQVEEAELLQRAKVLEAEMAELEASKCELVHDLSKDSKSGSFESFDNHERLGNWKNEVIVKKGPVVREKLEKLSSSLLHLTILQKYWILAGDDLTSSQIPDVQLASQENFTTKDEDTTGKSRLVNGEQKSYLLDVSSVPGFTSQNSQHMLRQAVLSHKKKALALKRDGKMAEAWEELRQAKLLEKSTVEDGTPKFGASDVSTSTSTLRSDAAKEQGTSALAPIPLSGRDRFKLQQESLGHKRKALKLRREGRMQEAEVEFELAKSLEAQLEELGAHDSTKSSGIGAEPVDDVVVEDLLDPQLLSALKAIGLDDSSVVAHGPARPELIKRLLQKVKMLTQRESN